MSYGYGKGIEQYRQTSAYSGASYADPHRLTQMLMEGALARIAQAKGAQQRGQTAVKGERIGKALSILDGLRESLDLDKGGELAADLAELYSYMQQRLLLANARDDVTLMDEVAGLMGGIKEAWDAIPQEARHARRPRAGDTRTTG